MSLNTSSYVISHNIFTHSFKFLYISLNISNTSFSLSLSTLLVNLFFIINILKYFKFTFYYVSEFFAIRFSSTSLSIFRTMFSIKFKAISSPQPSVFLCIYFNLSWSKLEISVILLSLSLITLPSSYDSYNYSYSMHISYYILFISSKSSLTLSILTLMSSELLLSKYVMYISILLFSTMSIFYF